MIALANISPPDRPVRAEAGFAWATLDLACYSDRVSDSTAKTSTIIGRFKINSVNSIKREFYQTFKIGFRVNRILELLDSLTFSPLLLEIKKRKTSYNAGSMQHAIGSMWCGVWCNKLRKPNGTSNRMVALGGDSCCVVWCDGTDCLCWKLTKMILLV